MAGLTVAALVIPLGLAFAELAGLPPVYGLYTSIIPVIVFGLVASSPQSVVGAEAALSGIVGAAIAPSVAEGRSPVEAVGTLTLMVGLICLAGALVRAGRLAQIVSRTVFVGYLAGVAVSVSVSQIPRLVGSPPFTEDRLLGQLQELPTIFSNAVGSAVAIGVVTCGAVLVGKYRFPRMPIALAALVLSAIGVWALKLTGDLPLIGDLPRSVLALVPPSLQLGDLGTLLPTALAIAVVGFADTTLVSQGFATRHGYSVNSSRDLAALGAADVASGLLGGLPVSASSARTAVAESSGARSQLAPMLSALAIALVLIIASGWVSYLPQAALAGIIIAVMVGIIDLPALRVLAAGRRSEFAVAIVAFLGVAAVGVLEGVLVAVGLSILVIVLRASRPHDAVLGVDPAGDVLLPLDEHPDAEPIPGVVVYRFDAPLFFGNADTLRDHIVQAVRDRGADATQHVIIAGAAISDVDYTGCQVLIELGELLAAHDVDLTVADVNHELLPVVDRMTPPGAPVRFTTDPVDHVVHSLR